MFRFSILSLFVFVSAALYAQPSNNSVLSIPQIMQGERFVGYLPEDIEWSPDSRTIYFSWNPEMDTLRDLYQINVAGGSAQRVSLEEQRRMPGRGGVYNKDRSKMIYEKGGDLFLLEVAEGRTTRLTHTVDRESNPGFSGDESHILYTRDDNVFAWNIETGTTFQLTNFRSGNERGEKPTPAYRDWLEDQQMELFEVLRERKTASELRDQRRDSLQPDHPSTVYYGKKRLAGLRVSPDMSFVTAILMESADEAATEVPYWVNESGYVSMRNARPKVGSPQSTYEFGIYDLERDTFFTLDVKQIPGIYDKPEYLREYHDGKETYQDQYEKPRPVSIFGPVFSDDGKAIVVVRSQDNKDRWIMSLDLPSGKLDLLDRQRDEAWIGGPGISGWNFSTGNMGWLADNETLWFQSEETGYSHLYTVNVKTGDKKALTSGEWEIRDAELSADKQYFYITANKEGPHEQHFYRMPAAGGELEKLTTEPGNHEVELSPDEKYLAVRYSYSNRPWELYLVENKKGASRRQLTESTTEAFRGYSWREPEIVRFAAADGASVPARLYKPRNGPEGGPAVIFVHGAGYLQNVHKWWSSYYREYMFHNLLVDNGYTVLDIDYRGSDGYGRDWRTGIYRHMGGKDLSDQVDGAKYLVEEHGVDAGKIGIYGGSYGGFITLMAMFTAPGTFRSGAALRSVTDWAHYNHGYTSNILNTPVEDSIAYQRSSPINFAEGLQGDLVILHGMVDTNVQFQDVVRLAQKLIELGKENWEFAVFPVEGHGFAEPSSWTDEYKRIFKLFQETLK